MNTQEPQDASRAAIPSHPLLVSLLIAVVLPFAARAAGALARGLDWLYPYLGVQNGILITLLSCGVGIVWFGVAYVWPKRPLVYWVGVAGGAFVLIWIHGTLDALSGPSAGLWLFGAPVIAGASSLVGSLCGYGVDHLFPHPTLKRRMAAGAVAGLILLGLAISYVTGLRDTFSL